MSEDRATMSDLDLQDRFWPKVAIPSSWFGCWFWQNGTSSGYGVLGYRRRIVYAHRYSYQLATGKIIPKGLVVDHLCCNKSCVNPLHMEIVTRGENVRRGVSKTECIHGHAKTPENIYITPSGSNRRCLPCMTISNRAASKRRSEILREKRNTECLKQP